MMNEAIEVAEKIARKSAPQRKIPLHPVCERDTPTTARSIPTIIEKGSFQHRKWADREAALSSNQPGGSDRLDHPQGAIPPSSQETAVGIHKKIYPLATQTGLKQE